MRERAVRLEELTPAHVVRAIEMYLERAYPPGTPARARVRVEELARAATTTELLAHFDRPREAERGSLSRYTLRLGNARYPFMKFVVQEYLLDRELFFSVDTHDELVVQPDDPDYAGWKEIQRHNLTLKRDIETAWCEAGLPTHGLLREMAEDVALVEREGTKHARLLVVDDESDVCAGLGALLRARGYEVDLAYDGRQALDRLERDAPPDLLVLDFSMPELDGQEVLRRVRASPRLEHLPVLLATASSIDVGALPRGSWVLRKPYARDVLFALLSQILERR